MWFITLSVKTHTFLLRSCIFIEHKVCNFQKTDIKTDHLRGCFCVIELFTLKTASRTEADGSKLSRNRELGRYLIVRVNGRPDGSLHNTRWKEGL